VNLDNFFSFCRKIDKKEKNSYIRVSTQKDGRTTSRKGDARVEIFATRRVSVLKKALGHTQQQSRRLISMLVGWQEEALTFRTFGADEEEEEEEEIFIRVRITSFSLRLSARAFPR
jgi:hypothetical protein